MRAFLITLACVIVTALLVTLMAEAPQLGLFRPVLSASLEFIDS